MFNIGILGATGFIGTPYREEIRACPQKARIVALSARRPERLQAAQELDGAALATDDWRQVVEHDDVNLVLVCTPDALHIEPALACAARGVDLFCEKPVGKNSAEAAAILSACRQANVRHYVPFWTRYVEVFRRGRELLNEGILGDVRVVTYRWYNPRPPDMPFTWRDDASLSAAGSIADVGSHAYDALRWLLGINASKVLTHATVLTPPKPDLGAIDLQEAIEWGESHSRTEASRTRRATVHDYATIAVEFQGGAVGVVQVSHASVLRKAIAPEIELHGTKASMGLDRVTGEITLAPPGGTPEVLERIPDAGFGNRFEKFVFPALEARDNGNTSDPSDHPDLHDGWLAQLFTDAAALSAERGAWVEIEELEHRSLESFDESPPRER